MRSSSTDLNVSNQNWIKLTLSSVRAEGRVHPRVVFTFEARTLQQHRHARIVQLDAWLSSLQNEVLGMGSVRELARQINSFGTSLSLVVPLTHNAIRFINERAQGHEIQLALQFNGITFAKDDKPDQEWVGLPAIEAGPVVLHTIGHSGRNCSRTVPEPNSSLRGGVPKFKLYRLCR